MVGISEGVVWISYFAAWAILYMSTVMLWDSLTRDTRTNLKVDVNGCAIKMTFEDDANAEFFNNYLWFTLPCVTNKCLCIIYWGKARHEFIFTKTEHTYNYTWILFHANRKIKIFSIFSGWLSIIVRKCYSVH